MPDGLLVRIWLYLAIAERRIHWLLPLNQLLLHQLLLLLRILHLLLHLLHLHGLLQIDLVGIHIHLLHLNHLATRHLLLLHGHLLLHVRLDWLRHSVAQRGPVIVSHWLLLLLLLLLHDLLLVHGWSVVELLVLVVHF